VRPAFRRREYAIGILRQALLVAQELGIDPALVTCDDVNAGSARVIERCGGVLAGVVPGPYGSAPKRHWVPGK
jgi:predicted acetyltransferase